MATKSKATHYGHCQVCECRQLLPNGKLSLHGYEVAGFGYFNGVCFGAKHLPIEQDKTIVIASITWAEGIIARIKADIATVKAEKGFHFAWVHVYKPAKWPRKRSSYVWEYCPVSAAGREHPSEYRECNAWTSEGQWSGLQHSIHAKNTQELCDQLNADYVEDLERNIEYWNSFIAGRRRAIASWHEQPLEPRKSVL